MLGQLPPRHRLALPLVGNALSLMRDPIAFQRRGHAAYGPVFAARVFSHRLTLVDPLGAPALLEQVLRAPTDELSIIEAYKELVGRIIRPEIFVETDKQLREGLSVKHINLHIGPTAVATPVLIAGRLGGERGEIDGLQFCNDAVFHVIAHYLLGPAAAERSGQELARLLHVLESDFSVLGMLLPIETPSARRRSAAFDRMMAIIEDEVRRRLCEGGEHADFLQFVIDDMRASERLASPEGLLWRPVPGRTPAASEGLRSLALRVLGAVFGAHTNTAMTVAACMIDLLEHPHERARVLEEVDALGREAPLDLAAMRKLVRLHRAMNETMRRFSTGGIWRRVMRPLELGEHHIPVGTLVGTSMGLVNLDPRRYLDPLAYRPDRYESMTTDAYQSPPVGSTPLQFGSFGSGRNLCSGRPLAYTMLALVLVTLLRDYEWTLLAKPRRWFPLMTAGMARPIGALRLAYRRR
jgi:sterol 14alpha-demethylase